MYIDKRLLVSSQQAIPDGTAVRSSDVIDLGSAFRLIGPGEPLWWVIIARVGLAADANPTMDIAIHTDDASNFPSATTLLSVPQRTSFPAGTKIVVPHPWSPANERYLSLYYDLGGTNPTLTVDAFLTNQEPASWVAYPDAL